MDWLNPVYYFTELLKMLKDFIFWLLEIFTDTLLLILVPICEFIGKNIPADWAPTLETAIVWLGKIDSWVPIGFGLQMLLLYYTIKSVAIGVKWVLKAIPGVWG